MSHLLAVVKSLIVASKQRQEFDCYNKSQQDDNESFVSLFMWCQDCGMYPRTSDYCDIYAFKAGIDVFGIFVLSVLPVLGFLVWFGLFFLQNRNWDETANSFRTGMLRSVFNANIGCSFIFLFLYLTEINKNVR